MKLEFSRQSFEKYSDVEFHFRCFKFSWRLSVKAVTSRNMTQCSLLRVYDVLEERAASSFSGHHLVFQPLT